MAQLKQDEWPADREPTTEETQVELVERDVRGQDDDAGRDGARHNYRGSDDLLNVDPDSATD